VHLFHRQKVSARRYYTGKTAARLPDELMLPKQYVGKTKVDIPATIQSRFRSLKDTLSDITRDPKMYKYSRDLEKARYYNNKGELVNYPHVKPSDKFYLDPKKSAYKSKAFEKGGLTNTVPPKRGPNSQGLKSGGDFDPEGKGYDYKTFDKLGGKRDAKGHGFSRNPKTGMLLKGRKHKTFNLGVSVDENLGYGLKKKGDRYYTEKLKRGIPAGKYKDMSKFSKGGCPHRETGVKSDIKGISNIQVKGKKFIGVK